MIIKIGRITPRCLLLLGLIAIPTMLTTVHELQDIARHFFIAAAVHGRSRRGGVQLLTLSTPIFERLFGTALNSYVENRTDLLRIFLRERQTIQKI